jgi:hypothetical protein
MVVLPVTFSGMIGSALMWDWHRQPQAIAIVAGRKESEVMRSAGLLD